MGDDFWRTEKDWIVTKVPSHGKCKAVPVKEPSDATLGRDPSMHPEVETCIYP